MLHGEIKYKVSSSGCWECSNRGLSAGYPQMKYREAYQKIHRIMLSWFVGPLESGQQACHTCDNRKCINPSHIYLGTPKTNSTDMANRGRSTWGMKNRHAKITPEQVILIKEDTRTQQTIANEYGIHVQTVFRIKKGLRRDKG